MNNVKDIPCTDCGKKYPPFVMDFDHRDPNLKKGIVSRLVTWSGWKKMIEEVKKCDVVCANCHRIRTHGLGSRIKRASRA